MSTRVTASRGTGMSRLRWPVSGSLTRRPLTRMRDCSKVVPRMARSAWTPSPPRAWGAGSRGGGGSIIRGVPALGQRQRLDGGGHLDAVDYNELYGWEDRAAPRGGGRLLAGAGRGAGLGGG